jgi:ribosomal protein S18 acetylase RimI-like enzyme
MNNIRKLKKEDRPGILDMIRDTDMFTPAEVDVAMELVDICLTREHQSDYRIFVSADHNDEAVGYVCYGATPATDGTFDLYWIVVSPEFQNKGIGKQLLLLVEKEVFGNYGRLIVIETSSQDKYFPTRQFYLRNNYTVAAQIKDFYRKGDDRVIFIKYRSNTKNGDD